MYDVILVRIIHTTMCVHIEKGTHATKMTNLLYIGIRLCPHNMELFNALLKTSSLCEQHSVLQNNKLSEDTSRRVHVKSTLINVRYPNPIKVTLSRE